MVAKCIFQVCLEIGKSPRNQDKKQLLIVILGYAEFVKGSKRFFKASINYQAKIFKDLDKCLLMLDLKHSHMNFRIPWHCSKILMFTVPEDLWLHSSYVSILHKILVLLNSCPGFLPTRVKEKSDFFFLFCENARCPEVSLLYLTLTISLYITRFVHLTFIVKDCPSLLNSLWPDFNSISAMTLRIPDEFSAFHY